MARKAKRQRPAPVTQHQPLPLVLYAAQRSPVFGLLEALCGQSDIILSIATRYLDPSELLKLYRISKVFHRAVDNNLPAFISSCASRWIFLKPNAVQKKHFPKVRTPHLLQFFPLGAYRQLCYLTIAQRPQASLQQQQNGSSYIGGAAGLTAIPCLKYLSFLRFRLRVVNTIIETLLHDYGLRLPFEASFALCKLWNLMDVPFNTTRIAVVRSPTLWTDADLYFITMFFIKLDMAMTDPVESLGNTPLRELMMAQKGLGQVARILTRKDGRNFIEMVQLHLQWRYEPESSLKGLPIFGVPPEQIGSLRREGWGRTWPHPMLPALGTSLGSPKYTPRLLIRPDELIMREGIRRGLKLDTFYRDMMMSGYVDPIKCKNIPVPKRRKKLDRKTQQIQLIRKFKDCIFRSKTNESATPTQLDLLSAADPPGSMFAGSDY
ncbi:MAG: hypothetical protein M1828_005715 [Chrysothrix sp. TS-e1954]|nr:MAG: hypothetical protein M1828_005715 [Chrysothrix sp. TS-e1954]